MLQAHESGSASDALCVIDVLFEVPPSGIVEIGSISASEFLEIPSGLYQLRYECYDPASSPTPRIRLLFHRNTKPRFYVVRTDSELDRGTDLLLTASPEAFS